MTRREWHKGVQNPREINTDQVSSQHWPPLWPTLPTGWCFTIRTAAALPGQFVAPSAQIDKLRPPPTYLGTPVSLVNKGESLYGKVLVSSFPRCLVDSSACSAALTVGEDFRRMLEVCWWADAVLWSSQSALNLSISLCCTTSHVCLTIRRKRRWRRSI